MSPTAIGCPNCGEQLEDDGRYAGQLVRCPNCATEFRLPGSTPAMRSPNPVIAEDPNLETKLIILQICMVTGGVCAIGVGFGLTITFFGLLWPGTYYSYLLGIIAIYRGATMRNRTSPPRGTAVMQIINIVCGDLVNVALGAAELVLFNDPAVEASFRRRKLNG